MFSGFYNIGITAYQTVLQLVAPVNAKARQWVEGRYNWINRLTHQLENNQSPIAWFHAASLGEFEQGRPVIEAYREQYPNHKILLTFFSPSGYEVQKHYVEADYVLYLPADTPSNAHQFVSLVKPRIAFFIKYEFWYNYLHELKAAHVPVICFSAIFRPNQLFFKSYGYFYRSLLSYFDHILVQNQASVQLLESIGIHNVTLAGDTRFDRVWQIAATTQEIPVARLFKDNQPLLVIGSAWPEDMNVLIPFINTFPRQLKVIIAPHEIHDGQISQWQSQLIRPSVRFSQTQEADAAKVNILVIDNVGMLSSLYQYGEFAYIGGAFRQGLHNILEAATFGMPLFFGPDYSKFQEAVDLVNEGAAFPIRNMDELTAAFTKQYADAENAAHISRRYVQRNIGAMGKVMEIVNKIMGERAKK